MRKVRHTDEATKATIKAIKKLDDEYRRICLKCHGEGLKWKNGNFGKEPSPCLKCNGTGLMNYYVR